MTRHARKLLVRAPGLDHVRRRVHEQQLRILFDGEADEVLSRGRGGKRGRADGRPGRIDVGAVRLKRPHRRVERARVLDDAREDQLDAGLRNGHLDAAFDIASRHGEAAAGGGAG